MKNKYLFVAVLLACILAVSTALTGLYLQFQSPEQETDDFVVVTSFYPIYVAAENVIGDAPGVKLENLSEPQTGCLHDYQLTAEDMKLLSTADVFVINGGGIESFLEDVAKAYPDLTIINACENLELEDDNAHAWMSLDKYSVQVETISTGLQLADDDNRSVYKENTDRYVAEVEALKAEYAGSLAFWQGQPVILFHEAYEFVAEEWGMETVGLMDLDEERQVSAGEVADVLNTARDYQVSFILAEELYGKSMGDMVEKESSVKVLYLDPLNRGDYSADSYLTGMRSNLDILREMAEAVAE